MNKKYIVRSTARERNLSEEILSKAASALLTCARFGWPLHWDPPRQGP